MSPTVPPASPAPSALPRLTGWRPSSRALAELRRQGVRAALLAQTVSPPSPA